jgi:predicted dehydrogenase
MAGKIRWGVIGSGGIALRRTIPEGIVPAANAELAAVYDINAAVNTEVGRRFGAAAVAGIAELLEIDLEAVYVATPAHLHAEQVLACARAGKHVLCEKPLGMSVVEAERMLKASNEAGVQLGTAFMMRFHSQHQAALKMIQEGRLGKPVYGRAQLSCWYPPIEGAWRQDPALGGGGSLIDMGGHSMDLLEMFFGPVVKASCFVNNTIHAYQPEDSAVAMLWFANGALATVDTFFCIPDEASRNVLELYGSLGSILAEGTIGQGSQGRMIAYLKSAVSGYDAQQAREAEGGMEIAPEPVNTYQAEIEEFSQAILEGRSSSLTGELGLRSQRVLAACYESARSGRAVTLPPSASGI